MRSLQIIFLLLVVLFRSNFVASAGAVHDSEKVEVKSGENVTLRVEKPGNVSRMTLQKNMTDPIILYCSPEEKKMGCTANKSDKFSINVDTENLNVTLIDARASDEGCYVVSYIAVDNSSKKKLFIVMVDGSPETPKNVANKDKETSWTISLIIIAVGIVLFIAAVIIYKKWRQNNAEYGARDPVDDSGL